MRTAKKLCVYYVSFACMLTLAFTTVAQSQKPLAVTILYESLCPDSVAFLRDQLGPNYKALSPYIDINLVPFGKSQSFHNGAQFACQHGPKECEGNRIQSCILAGTDDHSAKVNFAVCQMSGFAEPTGNDCANKAGIFVDIDQCVKTTAGTELQLMAESETAFFSPTFIPTIIYDGEFIQHLQDASLKNFKKVVCDILSYKVGQNSNLNNVCV